LPQKRVELAVISRGYVRHSEWGTTTGVFKFSEMEYAKFKGSPDANVRRSLSKFYSATAAQDYIIIIFVSVQLSAGTIHSFVAVLNIFR